MLTLPDPRPFFFFVLLLTKRSVLAPARGCVMATASDAVAASLVASFVVFVALAYI